MVSPRTANPVRAAEMERAIVEVARDLLAEGGLEAISMRALAGRLGLSAAALYGYFDSKEDLVERVVLEGFRLFEDRLGQATRQATVEGGDALGALAAAYLGFAKENPQYFKVMFSSRPGQRRAVASLPSAGGFGLLRDGVERAMDAGRIRRGDPNDVALLLWSQIHGLATLWLSFNPRFDELPSDPMRAFETIRPLISQGLAPDHGDRSG